MSTGAVIAIIVVVVVVGALVVAVAMLNRRHRLQQKFGPEYDRALEGQDSKIKAEAELAGRERRVRGLEIRPLSNPARERYFADWVAVQERFVDAPQLAVADAYALVATVMTERGYPVDDYDQVLADLSVEHASTLDHLRSAQEISRRAGAGEASTEELRQAMIHYRELFGQLLGSPDGQPDGAGVAGNGTGAAGLGVGRDRLIDGDPVASHGDAAQPGQSADGAPAVQTPYESGGQGYARPAGHEGITGETGTGQMDTPPSRGTGGR